MGALAWLGGLAPALQQEGRRFKPRADRPRGVAMLRWPSLGVGTIEVPRLTMRSLYGSGAERQSWKLKVLSSIPSGGSAGCCQAWQAKLANGGGWRLRSWDRWA